MAWVQNSVQLRYFCEWGQLFDAACGEDGAADLVEAEVEDGFVEVDDRLDGGEVDGVGHAQDADGHALVIADDPGDFLDHHVLFADEIFELLDDGGEGGQELGGLGVGDDFVDGPLCRSWHSFFSCHSFLILIAQFRGIFKQKSGNSRIFSASKRILLIFFRILSNNA
jgi:hypothetical protein